MFTTNPSGTVAIDVNESWSDNSTDPLSSGGGLAVRIDIADITVYQ